MEPYQGYKSAIIFLLPELMKQGLLQGQISNVIARDAVEGNNILNLTKQKPEFYQKGQYKIIASYTLQYGSIRSLSY